LAGAEVGRTWQWGGLKPAVWWERKDSLRFEFLFEVFAHVGDEEELVVLFGAFWFFGSWGVPSKVYGEGWLNDVGVDGEEGAGFLEGGGFPCVVFGDGV